MSRKQTIIISVLAIIFAITFGMRIVEESDRTYVRSDTNTTVMEVNAEGTPIQIR